MRLFPAIFIAICAAQGFADELVLKDGRRVTWKALVDQGESIEVETLVGKKLSVKKDDIDKVVFTQPPVPLTGASFARDIKKKVVTFDLLQTVDLKRDVVAGQWKAGKTGLVVQADGLQNCRLQFKLPIRMPEEYDIAAILERKAGTGDFEIGMVAPSGKQFELVIDAGGVTGLPMSDGKLSDQTANALVPVLPLGAPHKLVCMVRKTGFVLKLDDKDIIIWVGDWSKTSVPGVHAVPQIDTLFLVCFSGTYEVSRLTMTYGKE